MKLPQNCDIKNGCIRFRKQIDRKLVERYFANTPEGYRECKMFVYSIELESLKEGPKQVKETRSVTFEWAATQYFTQHFTNNKERTERAKSGARYTLNRMISLWGSRPLESITYLEVQAYLNTLSSQSTANRHLASFRSLYKFIRNGNAMGNVFPYNVYLPDIAPGQLVKKKSEKLFRRDRVMTVQEWHEIQQYANPVTKSFALISLFSQLRHKDVRLLVSNPLQSVADTLKGIQAKTKNPYSVPQLTIITEALESLKAAGPITYWRILRGWQRACKKANVKDLTIRDLRRTGAEWMRRLGVSKWVIQGMLGHSNASTTDIYLGVTDDEKKDAVEKLVAHFGSDKADISLLQ